MAPSVESLQKIYRRRFPDGGGEERARLWRTLVESYFQRWIDPGAVVVDLGCGYGEFLRAVRCARRIGVDLNEDVREHLGPEVEFHGGGVTDLGFLPEGSVDVVFTSNLMEHLANKAEVEAMLRETHRILRAGGTLLALGPNARFLPGAYWDFWDHHVPITDRSLVEILEVIGFEVEGCLPRFLPYTTCSRLPRSPGLIRLYLRLPPVWRVLGRQFLIRARRTVAGP